MTRAEYEREVYDYERQRGEYAEDEDPFAPNEPAVLATYALQLIGPRERWDHGHAVPFGFAAYVAEAAENLTDLLPEGYSVKIEEWDR